MDIKDTITLTYEDLEHLRIDKYLASLEVPELYSRTLIESLIGEGKVQVNQENVKKNFKLSNNDIITVELPEPEPTGITPQNIPLDIIFEDEHLAIINKPAGLVVHPGIGNRDNTLVNGLVYHFANNLSDGSQDLRPGIVHRLDKDTSGLLIVAKTNRAQSKLQTMFQNKEITKFYRAIVVGHPKEHEGTIESFIEKVPNNPRKMRVSDKGKWSITHWKVIKYYHFFSYLNINLETGRTHQIRIHFQSKNIPILGDTVYNSVEASAAMLPSHNKKALLSLLNNKLSYQALHAFSLGFDHPITGQSLYFEAPLPDYFENTLKWLEFNFAYEDE